MEDAEEIESFYEKAMEDADKEFLEETKKPGNGKGKRKVYREKINSIREEYEKKYEKHFKLKKNEKNKKTKAKKEKIKPFKARKINLKETKKQKFKRKYSLFKFRFRIKRRNLIRKITPGFLMIFFLKTKILMKRLLSALKKIIIKTAEKVKDKIISAAKRIKELSKKVYVKTKKFFSSIVRKIVNKISPKKKEEDKKAEDQILAEKILAKK